MATPAFRTIWFPIVGPTGAELNAVHVELMPTLNNNQNFANAPSIDIALETLLDARAADSAADRLAGVLVDVNDRRFTGRSLGLALAIADQRVRRPSAPNSLVVATGCLQRRGRGVLDPVDGFEEKFNTAIEFAEAASSSVIFAFPRGNWDELPCEFRESAGQRAMQSGLALLPCTTLADASDLWAEGKRPTHKWRWLVAISALVSVGSFVLPYFWTKPLRTCEQQVRSLPDQQIPRPQLAAAILACQAAIERFPEQGRPHFLLAQLRAVDNSPVLAATEWQRSAELGDVDGMASHGRRLWQQRPSQTDEAQKWLRRAASLGSVAAAEDLGYMALERDDRAKAAKWFAHSKSLESKGKSR
jgi:hypothetical protein